MNRRARRQLGDGGAAVASGLPGGDRWRAGGRTRILSAMDGGGTSTESARSVGVVVAHPDDETLWAGGLLLSHPEWSVSIVSLCRRDDPDRAPRFRRVCASVGGRECRMGDLDDGPEQSPLPPDLVEQTVLDLLPSLEWDLILTHSPLGEYTSHLRHQEISVALARLWLEQRITAREVWLFAYEDAGRTKLPEACSDADLRLELSEELFLRKYSLITEGYGFEFESWEARATPRTEGFWRFSDPQSIFARFDGRQ